MDGIEVSQVLRPAPASFQDLRVELINRLSIMQRDTQLWLAGSIIVAVGLGSFVVLHQRDELSHQKRLLEQQKLQSNALKDRSFEDERLRRLEDTYALQIKALDAEQARNTATATANQANRANQAASEQQAQDRQRLEGQIQELQTQRASLVHQAECAQTQSRMRLAEQAGDSGQVKATQERWNANCAS
jgi:hypothetical protein